MVMDSTQATFRAIADPTRRAILDLLAGGDLAVKEIVAAFRVSQPAVSRHLRILREARLVREQRLGRLRVYRITPESLRAAAEWVDAHEGARALAPPTLRAWVDARGARPEPRRRAA